MEQRFKMDHIEATLKHMVKLLNRKTTVIEKLHIADADYDFRETMDADKISFRDFQRDETWGGEDKHFYFECQIDGSAGCAGEPLLVYTETGATDIWNTDNPQILVYKDGRLCGTMDMNHQDVLLTENLNVSDHFELIFYAYSNCSQKTNFFHISAIVPFREMRDLYFDIQTIYEGLLLLEENDVEKEEGIRVLEKAIHAVDFRNISEKETILSIGEARRILEEEYFSKNHGCPVLVDSVGFTHIDVAWKWRMRQTRQKAVRSFLTVLNLMNQYPEYRFMSSTPLLYEFVKKDAPGIYRKIKERIQEGRWEAEGAVWLEPDVNMISGESMIRHFLYGKQFFEEELAAGKQEILWLPDCFGFSGALPQIMKQFGVRYFTTTKTGWNDHNRFPNDTFRWIGLDGSEVLGYIITTRDYDLQPYLRKEQENQSSYNGMQNPSQIMGTWQRYQNKDLNQELLTVFGFGDGGGGTTYQMLERDRRLSKGIAGIPRTKQSTMRDFFHHLEKNLEGKQVPGWHGEIYLEYHRGTYTSAGDIKKNNRIFERELVNTETMVALSRAFFGMDSFRYQRDLEECWKLLLQNQFHDILPGSSVKEVYEDATEDFRRLQEKLNHIRSCVLEKSEEHVPQNNKFQKSVFYWNTTGYWEDALVELETADEKWMGTQSTYNGHYLVFLENIAPNSIHICSKTAELPERNVMEKVEMSDTQLLSAETKEFRIRFNEAGELSSIFDKKEKRELVQRGKCANRIVVYEDIPRDYSAWNTDVYYQNKYWEMTDLEELLLLENGPWRAVIRIKRKFLHSTLEQDICFYSHTRRIDFKTRMNWQEHETLVKAHFPMDILSRAAVFDTQFGTVTRSNYNNTSWEQAQFEVCGHHFADLSESDYGVALLNDSKYGYAVKESDMSISLLKTGIFPNPDSDIGKHSFIYALFPHQGDFRKGRVVREGDLLNQRPCYKLITGADDMERSFLHLSAENAVISVIKMSQDAKYIVVRFYESQGKRTWTTLYFEQSWKIFESDASESKGACLGEKSSRFTVELKPYQIMTLLLEVYPGEN